MKKSNKYKGNRSILHKVELLTLIAIGTMSVSGSFAYASIRQAANDTNISSDGGIVIPDTDDDSGTSTEDNSQSALGYILNGILSSKSLNIKNLNIVANPGSATTQATLSLSNLGLDLSEISSTNLSAQGDLAVSFGGYEDSTYKNTLTTSMHFALEDLTTLYLSAFSGNYRLSAPRTIAQVSTLINKFTPSSSDKSSQTSNNNTEIVEIIDKIGSILSGSDTNVGLKVVENSDNIDITINDLVFGETGKTQTIISGLHIKLGYKATYDENDSSKLTDATLTSLEVGSQSEPIKIQQQYNGSEVYDSLASLYISATGSDDNPAIVVDSQNGLTLSDHSSYTDMTDPNQSIFSTIGDIFMKDSDGSKIMAKANIDLSVDVLNSDNSNYINFDGSLKLDASNVSQFLSSSKMLLEVNNTKKALTAEEKDETLDFLKVYYAGGSEGAAYVNLDDDYKVKIDNTASSSLVDYISNGNGKTAISNIIDQLSSTLNAVPTDTVKEGNTQETIDKIAEYIYKQTGKLPTDDLNSLIKFTYSSTSEKEGQFVFALRKDLLGMKSELSNDDTDWMKVTINLTTDDLTISNGGIDESYSGRIQNIVVSGIEVGGKNISITIGLSSLTDVTIDPSTFTSDSTYVSINGTVGIIKTLGDYFVTKKGGVTYNLTYLPEKEDESSFGLSGAIGVDLSEVGTFSQLSDSNNVLGLKNSQFYLTSNISTTNTIDTSKNHSRQLDVSYQKNDSTRNLYFSYDDCFKNYVSDASISDICSILDSKLSTQSSSASTSLIDMNKIVSALGVSTKFQDDLKKIKEDKTLSTLKSFLSVKQGDSSDIVILSLNTGYIFEGSSLANAISSIEVEFNASADEFKSIKVSGYRTSGNALLDFTLNFGDFDTTKQVSDFTSYEEIKDATAIFNSFYNLPTTLDNYGLNISASINDSTKNSLVFGLDSGLVIDKTHNNYDGAVILSHPSLSNLDGNNTTAKQKIEFAYDSMTKTDTGYESVDDPTFVAEYNDRMHIKLGSSSVKDLVSTISNDKSTHYLLEALSSLEGVASSLPISTTIESKDASLLLENRLVKKVEFNDTEDKIILTMYSSIFNSNASSDDVVTVTIEYTDSSDAKLNKISLSNLTLSGGKEINASISLEQNYDGTLNNAVKNAGGTETTFNVAKPSDSTVSFVDLSDFNDLIKSGMDTTNFNYYSLKGNVSLDLTAWLQTNQINIDQFSVDLDIKYTLFLADGKAYMDLYIERDNGNFVDFKIANDYVYVVSSNTSGSVENNNTYKAYRMTASDAKDEILYLALTETLDIDSKIAGKTLMAQLYNGINKKESTTSESTTTSETSSSSSLPLTLGLSDDFSSLLSQSTIKTSIGSNIDGESLDMWSIVLNLNSMLTDESDLKSIVSFGDTRLDVYNMAIRSQDENNNWVRTSTPLYGLKFKTSIDLLPDTYGSSLPVCRVGLNLSLHANYSNSEDGYGVIDNDTFNSIKDGSKTASNNVENSISNYFASINAINNDVSGDYKIVSKTLKSKELYDFTSSSLIQFYNDYEIVDNNAIVYTSNYSSYYKN